MSPSFDPAMVCFRSCLVFTTALRAAEGCSDQGMGCNGAIPRPNHQKTSVMETRQSYVDANIPFAWPAVAAKDMAQTEVKQSYSDPNVAFAWPATAAKDSTLTEVKQSYSDANVAFAWPATAAKDASGKDEGSQVHGWGPDGYSRFFDTEEQELAFFQEHLTGQRTEWIAQPESATQFLVRAHIKDRVVGASEQQAEG